MCITMVAQPGNFLNVQFGNIDFFVFLQNQNKTGSTRGGSTKEARLYTGLFSTSFQPARLSPLARSKRFFTTPSFFNTQISHLSWIAKQLSWAPKSSKIQQNNIFVISYPFSRQFLYLLYSQARHSVRDNQCTDCSGKFSSISRDIFFVQFSNNIRDPF